MLPGAADVPGEGLIEGILQRGEPTTGPLDDSASQLLTFLFADIRGYTTFTRRRGDRAAAELVAKFERIVRDLVRRFDGTVLEVRGDEVLCVFSSPRQCLRLAVALQQRFVEETQTDASLPLAVGIGIDAGEAVPVPHGYRGDALNLAARLCARATAGDVLASPEVTHLARKIDGIRFLRGGRLSLKGFTDPVRPIRVLPDGLDPAARMAELLAAETSSAATARPARWLPGPLGRRPGRTAAGAITVVALAIGVLVAVMTHVSRAPHLPAFGENSLGIIDPQARTLVSEVAVDPNPIAAATGLGAVWTANSLSDSVSRVEIASHEVHTIQVGSAPSAIAVGAGSVWVTNSVDGTVSRIDPAANRVQAIPVGSSPGGIVVAHGWVWVTNTGDGTVDRIDPSTNAVVQTLAVGSSPSGIGAGRDIWIANSSTNTVTRIDGFTHEIVSTIPVGHDPKGVAVVDDTVWVTNNLDGNVATIAPGSSAVNTVPVGPQPAQLAAVAGHVWVASQTTGTIAELDPASSRVVHTVHVGPIAGALVAVNGKLWVSTTVDPTRHRGGTLRLLGHDVATMDPSYWNDPNLNEMYDQTYDGLVAFRRAGGADGTIIVPDLATQIPDPIDSGRTYIFHVRTGIRWSDGRPLAVTDIERGLQRTIAAQFSALGSEIEGGSACGERGCDLPGVTVDSAARTVTITLVRPDGNFIDDLTASVAVPSTTPLGDQKNVLVPTTGPYRIARYVPHRLIAFTRNAYYRPWAPAAQPPGYPDRIEWRIDPADDRARHVREVGAQRADWADARRAASLETLAARFGGRLWLSPTQTVHGLALNTRIPPFSDVRVRRALAYALNRRAVADAWITPGAITCQIIPPGLPAHRPYCPYTLQPDANGDWTAPDFPTAQALIARSPYHGTPVTVWAEPAEKSGFAQVVSVLRQLGFPARLRLITSGDTVYFPFVADSTNKVQAFFYGFITGDASPASLLEAFSCSAFRPADGPNNPNPAEFCDPSIDRLMSRARSIERSAPATANTLWAQVDKRIVDAAPWVPLVTPSWIDVLSSRTHNYIRSVVLGVLFDQLWVR